jgi:hypothetical protein
MVLQRMLVAFNSVEASQLLSIWNLSQINGDNLYSVGCEAVVTVECGGLWYLRDNIAELKRHSKQTCIKA